MNATRDTIGFAAALLAASGVFLLTQRRRPTRRVRHARFSDWMRQSGVEGVSSTEFVMVEGAVFATTTSRTERR